ncbi:sporulation protein YqfD [Clostridium senegalense]|uniref:Sporulation protein YqfD n=2 Tax=Clostridium senegalense TaxID=1465809 RepID=A0A6M0GYK5_9CLOT|nr:sporulation protein YqfD [Clostridium senegalense]
MEVLMLLDTRKMSKDLNYKKGLLVVEIETVNLEKLINFLWRKDVKVRNLKRNSLTNCTMEIEFIDYEVLLEGVKKTNSKLKVLNRKGIMFKILKLKRRRTLLVTVLIFVGVLYYLSSFIWKIEVVTESYIAPFEIRELLKSYGIEKGTYKNSFDVHRVEERIIDDNDEVMWVKARIDGSKLKVEVIERQAPPKIKEEKLTGNIVAKRDGEVQRIFSQGGTVMVERGKIVKKGDLLIKGEQGKEGKEYDVKAEGNVFAKTFYEQKKEIPKSTVVRKKTGEKARSYYIKIGGKKVYIKNALNAFENYDKIENNKWFIGEEIYEEVLEENVEANTDMVIKELSNNVLLNLDKFVKVLEVKPEIKDKGDNFLVTVLVIAEEDISLEEAKSDIIEENTERKAENNE